MVDGGTGSGFSWRTGLRYNQRMEANISQCKKESHERNANMLNSEKTVAIKGV